MSPLNSWRNKKKWNRIVFLLHCYIRKRQRQRQLQLHLLIMVKCYLVANVSSELDEVVLDGDVSGAGYILASAAYLADL